MKKLLLAACLISLLVLPGCNKAAKEFEKDMEQYIASSEAVGVSCAVVKDNKIVYNHNFGVKDLATGEPVDDKTIFRIASISKSFTATGLLQMQEQGKVSLQDDVSDLLGFTVRNPKYPDVAITLEMLLSHTSSINDSQGYWSTIDIINPDINPSCGACFNDYAPGSGGYEYCNLNLNLAGTILERVSGERFDQYVVNHILKPLGLYGGYCVDSLDASRFAHLYEWDAEAGRYNDTYGEAYAPRSEKVANYVMGHDALIFSPTGGMKISALDLARYMTMHMNYGTTPDGVRIISEESSRSMQYERSAPEHYGLNLWLADDYVPGVTLVGHTGGAYGLRSAMFFNPEEKYGFVIICSGHHAPEGQPNILHAGIEKMYNHFIATK
ncbi:MAG: beta-lactamase family protein [Bacteroidales bacterium]|nr:beta-lactamase family protein [Bacteroidales bacterium]